MSSTKTKENLIEIIANQLLEKFTEKKILHKLVLWRQAKAYAESVMIWKQCLMKQITFYLGR